jgi:hypothetical protein
MAPRKRSLVLLAATALLVIAAAVDVEYGTTRAPDSPVARKTVRFLEEGQPEVAALNFGMPSSYTAAAKSEEQRAIAAALGLLEKSFGRPSAATPYLKEFESYDVSVGSGPRPGWWESEPGFREARTYVYETSFSTLGSGYLLILTVLSKEEQVVSVSFALPAASPGARERVGQVSSQLLDSWGIPQDHPTRKQDRPATRTPPVPAG